MRFIKILLATVTILTLCLSAHRAMGAITFTEIHGFVNYDSVNGYNSQSALVQHSNGYLYGTTSGGGANNEGTVFGINTNGSWFDTLVAFNLYNGGFIGSSYVAGPIEGTDGYLYGTTENGGANLAGEVYQVTGSGINVLYSFTGGNDGDQPYAGLVQGMDGNFYGTTTVGGYWTFLDPNNIGYGTVFKITPTGTLATLYSFIGSDGFDPQGNLVQGTNGILYGTTSHGGAYGYGTVFKITTNSVFNTLYSFTGGNDGSLPRSGLMQGKDGNFYGTTYFRGAYTSSDSSGNGYGTIFKITASGGLTTLASFNNTNGANPNSTLVLGTDGNLYGATDNGLYNGGLFGTVLYYPNFGSIFQMTPAGIITTIVSFDVNDGYGANPNGLAQGKDGNLYGTCGNGGNANGSYGGIVFRLTLPPVDTTPPTVAIGSPTSGQTFTASPVTVSGTATDPGSPSSGVSLVQVQVNGTGGIWQTASGTTSWSASAALTSGTNTIYARSKDTVGNYSTVASVNVTYNPPDTTPPTVVISNPTSGQTFTASPVTVSGTATDPGSPNSGVSLVQVQVNGTGGIWQTASGTTSWSASAALTSGANKIYVRSKDGAGNYSPIASVNVTYNPPDMTTPIVSITTPTSGQRWSNAVFTVTGTASDNVQVGHVWLQLNGGVLTSAITANVYTNWNAALNLIPGTNTVAAYAVDTSGNVSTTNSRSFQFVVTNRLSVQATGLGTISPNYSNSWVEIGRNYSMTATPATGFVVTNWTISTNWLGGRTTNSATVQFMMASNLTLQINFADVTKPALTVSSPTNNKKMTNALASLVGTTKDNWKVGGVWNQLNGGAWSPANTTNNFTNWTATLTLIAGSNTIKSFAQDWGGNFSTTNNLSVTSSNTFKLLLNFANSLPMKTNGLVFSLQLSTGLNGHIQISSNLTSWVTLTNFIGTNVTLNFRDASATNSSQRFYRAVIP